MSQQFNQLDKDDGSMVEFLVRKARQVEKKHTPHILDTGEAFKQVAAKSGLENEQPSAPSYWKYAAAAAILIGAIGLGYLLTPNQIKVPRGQTQAVTLPDNTAVTLNSGSELSYPKWFNLWDRTVTLNGEAFFEVTNTGNSFVVEAGPGRVTVMGTKFNVRSWTSDRRNRTSVYLQEGRVSFSAQNNSKNVIILEPGEYSWISDSQFQPAKPKAADKSKSMAWLKQGLSFENQPLSVIFDEIARRFDVTIQAKPEDLLDQTLTIYLSNVTSAEKTLDDICRATGLSYNRNGGTFIITKSL